MENKYYKFSKNGQKMIIDTIFKEFQKQTNYITSGNVISNTELGFYIRPKTETECNGKQFKIGELQQHDLEHFKKLPYNIKQTISEQEKSVCLYEFRIWKYGIKDIIGYLVIDEYNRTILKSISNNGNYEKRKNAIDICEKIIKKED